MFESLGELVKNQILGPSPSQSLFSLSKDIYIYIYITRIPLPLVVLSTVHWCPSPTLFDFLKKNFKLNLIDAFRKTNQRVSVQFSSVAQSCQTLRPHGLQHARLSCPSPTPGVYLNTCPLCQWWHPTISSSVVPFSSCLQSFPASGSFQMSQLFTSGGQSIEVSVSASVLPMNIQDWFPLGWTGWISLQSKGLSRFFSNATVQKHQFFSAQLSLWSTSPYMTTGKSKALTRWTFVGKVMSLLFNMLPRLVITFLPRSKHLLISWLQSAVILEPKKIKSLTVSMFPHLFAMKWWDLMPWSSFSECWALSQLFHSPLSFSSRGSLVLLHFLP